MIVYLVNFEDKGVYTYLCVVWNCPEGPNDTPTMPPTDTNSTKKFNSYAFKTSSEIFL